MFVVKATGDRVVFDKSKLKNSLERSGAKQDVIMAIVKKISNSLYEDITTKEIYRKAFSLLKKSSKPRAARYKLKRAILELGPTGYPFEKYVGEILRAQGYTTQVGVVVEGHCVAHEVDVVAEKDNKHFMIECKFHNDQKRRCDVKIPLYIQSRFKDVEKQWQKGPGHVTKYHMGWIYTNTRFTSDAIQYARCSQLMLVSWDYPENGNLKNLIDAAGLYPITSLSTLTKKEKQLLLSTDTVLCKSLCENTQLLVSIGIDGQRARSILEEAAELCGI